MGFFIRKDSISDLKKLLDRSQNQNINDKNFNHFKNFSNIKIDELNFLILEVEKVFEKLSINIKLSKNWDNW